MKQEPLVLKIAEDGTSLDLGNGLTALIVVQQTRGGPLPPAEHTRLLKEVILPHIVSYSEALETESDDHDGARAALRAEEGRVQILDKALVAAMKALDGYKAREAELAFREGVIRSMKPGDEVYVRSSPGEKVRLDAQVRWSDTNTGDTISGWNCWRTQAREFVHYPDEDLSLDPVEDFNNPPARKGNWLLGALMVAALGATVLAHLAISYGPIAKLHLLNH